MGNLLKKEVFKRGTALVSAALTLSLLSGCKQDIPGDWPEEYIYINQDNNNLNDFTKMVVRNGESVVAYSGVNLAVTINKDTYQVKEYLFYEGIFSAKIFDLNTGHLIVDASVGDAVNSYDAINNSIILDNCYVVEFRNIGDYIEGEQLKDYYTLDEIRALEPVIVDAVKLMYGSSMRLIKGRY